MFTLKSLSVFATENYFKINQLTTTSSLSFISSQRTHILYKYLGKLDLHQQCVLTPAASSPAPGVLGTRGSDGARRGPTNTSRGWATSVERAGWRWGGHTTHSGERLSCVLMWTLYEKLHFCSCWPVCVCVCVTCLRAGHVWTWACHRSLCHRRDAKPQRSPAAPPCSGAPGSGWGLGEGLSCLEVWRSDCPSLWWALGTAPSQRAPRPWAVTNPKSGHFVSKHTG